ncbi:MAG: heme-degrading domain-containing protein [Alkalispirochaeta sp.]
MTHLHDLIDELTGQEQRIRFSSFSPQRGIDIGFALYEAARAQDLAVAIDVYAFGQALFHVALPGTSPDNDRWIERKRAVVMWFHKSSFRVGRELEAAGKTIDQRYYVDPHAFSPHGGSFPIRLRDGGVIGTVTVSGLPQEEDHGLVVSVLEVLYD